jgi:hypothetical protein
VKIIFRGTARKAVSPRSLCKQFLLLAFGLSASILLHAQSEAPGADEVVLKNGSRLIGTVTAARDGVVTVETDFAGTLSIAMDQVLSVNAQNPMVVLMSDDSVITESTLVLNEEELVLGDTGQVYPLEDLRVVNPDPWELGEGYRWSGLVSVALDIERGNTDTDEYDSKLESEWRSTRDRYTLKFDADVDRANSTKNADKWSLLGKYDYFLADPNYVGLVLAGEYDKFKDLNLRYLIGPYLGRQFYDEPVFTFSGELGFSYVNENFVVAEDQEYGATNWNLAASSDYLGGGSSLYFDQIGIWNLKDTSDVIINSTFGLSYPLLWQLEAAAEILLEYDSGAVPGVDELDQTYNFRLGYTW